jgi:hypothetical protein
VKTSNRSHTRLASRLDNQVAVTGSITTISPKSSERKDADAGRGRSVNAGRPGRIPYALDFAGQIANAIGGPDFLSPTPGQAVVRNSLKEE